MNHWQPPTTTWAQGVLFPPPVYHVEVLFTIDGPLSTTTWTAIVRDPVANEEHFVRTGLCVGESVLPAPLTETLRELLTTARMAVSPF